MELGERIGGQTLLNATKHGKLWKTMIIFWHIKGYIYDFPKKRPVDRMSNKRICHLPLEIFIVSPVE